MDKKNILVVCTGNTCRSPLAEAYLKKYGSEHVNVKSAGISAAYGHAISNGSKKVLEKEGIELNHASQPLSEELIQWADEVLTMSSTHKQIVEERYPHQNVSTLQEAAGKEGHDIQDPFGGTDEDYEQTAKMIKKAVKDFLRQS